ncbi:uncharacterized protein LOC120342641 isoform X1 [Styela clava]
MAYKEYMAMWCIFFIALLSAGDCQEEDTGDLAEAILRAFGDVQADWPGAKSIDDADDDDNSEVSGYELERALDTVKRFWSGRTLLRTCPSHTQCAKMFGKRVRRMCDCPQGTKCITKSNYAFSRTIPHFCL